jgi:hypothetical protein
MKNNSEASKAPDEAFGATHVLTCKTEFAENVVPDRIAALTVSHDTRNRRCVARRPKKLPLLQSLHRQLQRIYISTQMETAWKQLLRALAMWFRLCEQQ